MALILRLGLGLWSLFGSGRVTNTIPGSTRVTEDANTRTTQAGNTRITR